MSAGEPRARVAASSPDVGAAVLARRSVPCICPAQEHGACGRTIDYSTIRRVVVERVACDRCPRTWTRVNA